MNITPFFRDLRSSYQSEIDDMTFDSDGKDILRQRLVQRRKEMDFLINMMESAPEMVAVAFHQAFKFTRPSVMDHMLSQDSDELPEWDALADSVELMPWAKELTEMVLAQPAGSHFLVIAAGLEYMFHRHDASLARASDSDEDHDEDDNDHDGEHDGDDRRDPVDSDDARDAKQREEAGADWMVEQGFDRKDA
jgi:phosphopantothenoylcysteine synthetase/decarboxylase